MSTLSMYIMVIASIGLGVIVMSKRFLKRNQNKEFTYRAKNSIAQSDLPIEKRINFRKKPFDQKDNGLPQRMLSFRDSYNKATKQSHSLSNTDLNKNFWIALTALVAIVVIILVV